ncbi:MAG: helicase HerA domain-containing protein [Thermoproteota archaeon]
MRSLSTPLELVAIVYLAIKILRRYGLRLSERAQSVALAALKTSIVFYLIGLVALLLGLIRAYSFVGFIGAALYSLTGNLITAFPQYFNQSFTIPIPSLNAPSELPLRLCTPPGEDATVSFNIHLGAKASSWISFKLKNLKILSRSLREFKKQLILVLGSESNRSRRRFPDIGSHLSKKISRGYLLDSSKPIDETLKTISQIGRGGVELSLQFAWMRIKGGIMAHHILLASSNDMRAFLKFETDLILKVPLLDFVKADTAIRVMRKHDRALLRNVGDIYLRNILPLGISYELYGEVERITLRDYVDKREAKPLSLPFPEGHALLVGGKSSGKTRFAKSLVLALKELDVATLVIDPNGEYGEVKKEEESSYLNPLRPPMDVDALTHSGSLLVFSPTIASIFTTGDPQEKVLEMVKLKDPSFRSFLLEIEGKVDEESVRLRKEISRLIEETDIDDVVRKISIPPPTQNVICIRVPSNNKKTASFLTELFFAWGASLAISKRNRKVVMVIEDADELLKKREIPKLLGYAKDYGLSLILVTRNFEGTASLGTYFSIIAGFGISREQDLINFQRLIGVRRDEPEGLQVEATVASLKSGECIIFLEDAFEFLRAKPLETRGVITFG